MNQVVGNEYIPPQDSAVYFTFIFEFHKVITPLLHQDLHHQESTTIPLAEYYLWRSFA